MSEVTLGGDPEFALFDSSKNLAVSTRTIFPTLPWEGDVGRDGRGDIGEFRFPPTKNPRDVTLLIKERLITVHKMLVQTFPSGIEIRGGAFVPGFKIPGEDWSMPLGGHIHLGHSHFTRQYGLKDCSFRNPIIVQRLLLGLDKYVGTILAAAGNPASLRHRVNGSYGRPALMLGVPSLASSDGWRPQPHGIEYRTPYSWIHSPLLTNAAFALSFLVAENSLRFSDSTDSFLARGPTFRSPSEHPLYSCHLNKLRFWAKRYLEEIKGFEGYREVEDLIDPIRELILSKRIVRANVDARKIWGIMS